MSVGIKSLKDGTVGMSIGDLVDAVTNGKTVLVTGMRFVNTGTSDATLNVYFRSGATGRRVLPKDVKLPGGYCLIDDSEITLEAGDKLQGLSTVDTVHYVISGIEREVV